MVRTLSGDDDGFGGGDASESINIQRRKSADLSPGKERKRAPSQVDDDTDLDFNPATDGETTPKV